MQSSGVALSLYICWVVGFLQLPLSEPLKLACLEGSLWEMLLTCLRISSHFPPFCWHICLAASQSSSTLPHIHWVSAWATIAIQDQESGSFYFLKQLLQQLCCLIQQRAAQWCLVAVVLSRGVLFIEILSFILQIIVFNCSGMHNDLYCITNLHLYWLLCSVHYIFMSRLQYAWLPQEQTKQIIF